MDKIVGEGEVVGQGPRAVGLRFDFTIIISREGLPLPTALGVRVDPNAAKASPGA